MPWRLKNPDSAESIICTGPGCTNGYIPCPVDHASQPFNGEWEGEPYYRCDECDWVIPDPDGENKYETAGMIYCPECCAGNRNDTYAGPCDHCGKLDCGAVYRDFPPDIAVSRAAKRYVSSDYSCPRCWPGQLAEAQREADQWHAEQAAAAAAAAAAEREIEARLEEKRRYSDANPAGTCDGCQSITRLAIVEHEAGIYLCFDCAPNGEIPEQGASRDRPPDTGTNAPPGWYPDPHTAGWARYWTGQRWDGAPVEQTNLEELHH